MKQQEYCKSVFKHGQLTKYEFTQKWILLVHQMEKNKKNNAMQHRDRGGFLR